jgi:hypothetical protein
LTVAAFSPPAITEDERQLITRLGWAVVRSWGALPANVQQQVREQAVFVLGPNTVQLSGQIDAFIKQYGAYL